MIRYAYADQLSACRKLHHTMLKDRAAQFHDRLKWEVSVDANGFETDQYDALNPLYAIWENPDGSHGGSMRFLPTTGATMVNDFFSHVTGIRVTSPRIWETTRFCVSPTAPNSGRIAALLMLAGAQIGVGFGLTHAVGVFDTRMIHIYRKLGWLPEILGTEGQGRKMISAGLWKFSPENLPRMAAKAGVSRELSAHWFHRAFGHPATGIAA
ncbi:acyl-homoserine-lactone synthase [Litoreibacter janthinus]|uniref:Acyl-homoserine-lactone synthase n=1 Tax=Litoreibacter janthinus TaxID=670154 RepID=A0A1I6GFJ6_9RHOB|nr:acyl-homoserine-lactone synthase [Litoreibacter janthinus]SFR40949.1 N-acyl-L-homoserine lactone synthetase [Litoreibacter janthinus]